MIKRALPPPHRSFFLFGPRGVGKSTYLKQILPGARRIDLLNPTLANRLAREPEYLDALLAGEPSKSWVILDEVQKVPALLDLVHKLIEDRGLQFALSGSSARKLKRGGANLLAGRAVVKNLEAFSYVELRRDYDLQTSLRWGNLPLVLQANEGERSSILDAYVNTYIREEIKEEGLVRKAAPFLRFLEVAAILHGQQVSGQNIAREAGIPRASVDIYFSILEDTLLGYWLNTYRPAARVREAAHPKFYWFDAGVARAAAGMLHDTPANDWLGFSLESLVFHELRVYREISEKMRSLSYYRTGGGAEIDFVIELKKRTTSHPSEVVLIEVKSSKKWDRKWNAAMIELSKSKAVKVKKMFGIYLGKDRLQIDNVQVLPVLDFFEALFLGRVF